MPLPKSSLSPGTFSFMDSVPEATMRPMQVNLALRPDKEPVPLAGDLLHLGKFPRLEAEPLRLLGHAAHKLAARHALGKPG